MNRRSFGGENNQLSNPEYLAPYTAQGRVEAMLNFFVVSQFCSSVPTSVKQ